MKCTIGDAKAFTKTIRQCMRAINKHSNRPILRGIEMVVAHDELVITALDGFAMVQRRVRVADCEDGSCIVIPAFVVGILQNMRGNVSLETVQNTLHLECHETGVSSSIPLMEGEYIKHEQLWTDDSDKAAIYVNPKILAQALDGLSGTDACIKLSFDAQNKVRPIALQTKDGQRALALPMRVMEEW